MKLQNNAPFLTNAAAFRNDEQDGNRLDLMKLFINPLMPLEKHYQFNAELVMVEWNFLPENEDKLNGYLSDSNIPQPKIYQYNEYAIEMLRMRQTIILNDSKWGLGSEQLLETTR